MKGCDCNLIDKTKEALGKNIKAARKQKKLTQPQLADLIGRTESSIRKYEKGLIDVPNEVITEIAKALDVLPADLIPLDEWEAEFNADGKLTKEARLLEQIQSIYGKGSVEILQYFNELNEIGRQKAVSDLADMTEVSKYKK